MFKNTLIRLCTMIKLYSSKGCKIGSKYINQCNSSYRLKNKKFTIISTDAEKVNGKIYHLFMLKAVKKLGMEGIYFNMIKVIMTNTKLI